MKPRGYLTQCEGGGWLSATCDAVARLDKPARWRCEECTKEHGPLPIEPAV